MSGIGLIVLSTGIIKRENEWLFTYILGEKCLSCASGWLFKRIQIPQNLVCTGETTWFGQCLLSSMYKGRSLYGMFALHWDWVLLNFLNFTWWSNLIFTSMFLDLPYKTELWIQSKLVMLRSAISIYLGISRSNAGPSNIPSLSYWKKTW